MIKNKSFSLLVETLPLDVSYVVTTEQNPKGTDINEAGISIDIGSIEHNGTDIADLLSEGVIDRIERECIKDHNNDI